MKILVTGGAGFIGSHLVDRLVNLGHEVQIIDQQRSKRKRFLNPGAVIHKMTIKSPQVKRVFEEFKPDIVFHLAAHISVTASVADPIMDAEINIVNALSLLEIGKKSGVKKFVFTSSGGAIYGDHPLRPTPELMDVSPLSPYGIAKQSFEHYLDHYSHVHNMQSVTLRFSNVYGPRQQVVGGYAGVIPVFISRLLNGQEITIFGDGSSSRDYIYVEDAVNALVSALDCNATGVINVSTGKETSILDLWTALKIIHGMDHPMKHMPSRPGEVSRSVLLSKKAEKELEWVAKTSLKKGLENTYNWFKAC